jgi:hypothetical protein
MMDTLLYHSAHATERLEQPAQSPASSPMLLSVIFLELPNPFLPVPAPSREFPCQRPLKVAILFLYLTATYLRR